MLENKQLDEIAHRIAYGITSDWGMTDDIIQAAWERFVRYQPWSRTGAWMMAASAARDILRKEKVQGRIKEKLGRLATVSRRGSAFEAAVSLGELRYREPEAYAVVVNYLLGSKKHSRAAIYRRRRKLRRVVEG